MSLNDDSASDIDEEKFVNFSSESSDSESYLEEDLKNGDNHIKKQWEAIERTLYQEDGQKVTDPELLRECKLWRETFPYFRVKGTKINVKKLEEGNGHESNKSIQTVDNCLNLTKLNEKRESIKNKVVAGVVERLIAKFGTSQNYVNSTNIKEKDFQVSVCESNIKTSLKNNDLIKDNNESSGSKNSNSSAEKESYFERGKVTNKETKFYVSKDEMEKSLTKIFDSWSKDERKSALKSPLKKSNGTPNSLKMSNQLKSVNFDLRHSTIRHDKPKSFSPVMDSIAKPFEMTKKIDKKYEDLLEKIMTRKYNELEPLRLVRATRSSTEAKPYQEALQRLRIDSGFDDYYKKDGNSPKINNFNNKWLERGEINYYSDYDASFNKTKNKTKFLKDHKIYKENQKQNEIDDRFVKDLKREMVLNYKRPPNRSEVIEDISLRRPKPFKTLETVGKTQRSSSCGNLPKRNKNIRSKPKSGLDVQISSKQRAKSTNSQNMKGNKCSGIKNGLLPPIESGIICTELGGRPKIESKNPSKRY